MTRETIWVEVLSRTHEVISRHRIDLDLQVSPLDPTEPANPTTRSRAIRVGRAYENDVILDDPHVAAHHLSLSMDENGTWFAQDMGSINGLYLSRGRQKQSRIKLTEDTVITVGGTLLRVRSRAAAVAPERAMPPARHGWKAAILVLMLALGLVLLQSWLSRTGETSWTAMIGQLIVIGGALLIWVGGWSLDSRFYSGQAKYERHFYIAAAGLLAIIFVAATSDILAFALSSSPVAEYSFMATMIVIGITIFNHMREVSSRHMRLKIAGAAAIAALGIGVGSLSRSESSTNTQTAQYLRQLKPPATRLVPSKTEEVFFAGAEKLKDRLDRARTEEQSGGIAAGALDFDD